MSNTLKPECSPSPLPDVGLQSSVNMASFYSRKHAEGTREALARMDLDVEKDKRIASCQCQSCYYLRGRYGHIAGQAFTDRPCDVCAQIVTYPTTHTQRYCEGCAKLYGLCRECGGDVHMKAREDPEAPRLKRERAVWAEEQREKATLRAQRVADAHREAREGKVFKP